MKNLFPVLLLVVVLASCGKKDADKSPAPAGGGGSSSSTQGAPAATKGSASPEEVFAKAKAAGEKKDWGTIYDVICPDEVDYMIFSASFMGAMTAMGDEAKAKEFDDMSKRYGIPDDKDAPKLDMSDPAKMKSGLAELYKNVKDKRGYFVAAFAWAEKNSKPGEGAKMMLDGTLEDLKVEGDTATATAVGAGDAKKPLAFRKWEGRWYMSVPKR